MELFKFHHLNQTLLPLCTGVVQSAKRWHKQRKDENQRQKGLGHDPLAYKLKLHLFPAKKVASELCLMDSELLQKIRPDELKNAAWTKKATKESVSPNVLAMVKAFNKLALLVPSEILAEASPQARANVIEAFIKVAIECRMLRNFNSLKAILAGLQCTPIYRLSSTWKAVSSRRKMQFDKLCDLMSEECNWQVYRAKLDKYLNNSTPFIPFLGMFLTQVIQTEAFNDMKKSPQTHVKDTVPEKPIIPGHGIDGMEKKNEEERQNVEVKNVIQCKQKNGEQIVNMKQNEWKDEKLNKVDAEFHNKQTIQTKTFKDTKLSNCVNQINQTDVSSIQDNAISVVHRNRPSLRYLSSPGEIHCVSDYVNAMYGRANEIFMFMEFNHIDVRLNVAYCVLNYWRTRQSLYLLTSKPRPRKLLRCIQGCDNTNLERKPKIERKDDEQEEKNMCRDTCLENVNNEKSKSINVKDNGRQNKDFSELNQKIMDNVKCGIVKAEEFKRKQIVVKSKSLKPSATHSKTCDTLLKLKRASWCCSINISSMKSLRLLLQKTRPNSENQNYHISLERERATIL